MERKNPNSIPDRDLEYLLKLPPGESTFAVYGYIWAFEGLEKKREDKRKLYKQFREVSLPYGYFSDEMDSHTAAASSLDINIDRPDSPLSGEVDLPEGVSITAGGVNFSEAFYTVFPAYSRLHLRRSITDANHVSHWHSIGVDTMAARYGGIARMFVWETTHPTDLIHEMGSLTQIKGMLFDASKGKDGYEQKALYGSNDNPTEAFALLHDLQAAQDIIMSSTVTSVDLSTFDSPLVQLLDVK